MTLSRGLPRADLELARGAQFADGLSSVHGGLVGMGDLAQRAAEIVEGEILAHLEGVEADAGHERDLVEEEIADRAGLAGEAEPRAQHPRPRERAPVAELGEFERDA